MRLIDADKAKAELLRIARDIHGWGEFFDGIRSGYQSAADRLDTMPTEEEIEKQAVLVKNELTCDWYWEEVEPEDGE